MNCQRAGNQSGFATRWAGHERNFDEINEVYVEQLDWRAPSSAHEPTRPITGIPILHRVVPVD